MFFNPKPSIKEDISRRSWLITFGLVAVAAAIVFKIISIQRFEKYKGKPWKAHLSNTIHIDTISAMRGNIYSSDGSLLVTSLPYFEIALDPTIADSAYFYEKIDTLCTKAARLFKDRSKEEYLKTITFARREWENNDRKGNRNIRIVRRKITFREQQIVNTWPFFRKFSSGKTKGGKLTVFYQRYKPYGSMAERTIGSLDSDKRGLVGIEARFEKSLAGKPGIGLFEILDDETRMPLEDDDRLQAESGADVYSTLNVNFQDIAESSLRKTLKKYGAAYGCAAVMETQTGEIRALANLTKKGDSTYLDTYNYAIAGLANPGSTFKLPTMIAALEEGLSLDRVYGTGDGQTVYNGVTIRDTKRGGHGSLTAQQVFEKSSNVGVHLIMRDYFYGKADKYCAYLNKFKLTEPTGIYMLGEPNPRIRNPKSKGWSKTSLTFMGYGYESELTPLQMLTFYNAVANNGYWVQPSLVKQVKKGDEVLKEIPINKANKPICSEATLQKARRILEGVVENGTAKNIKNDQYKIAGKTGTAQKLVNGRYVPGLFNVSFIGYFPAQNPRYTCLVMIDSPRGSSMEQLYAGSVVAPVFKDIADRIVGYDVRMHPNIPSKKNEIKNIAQHLNAGNADDLRSIAENLNLDAQPTQNGWVAAKGKGANVRWASMDKNPNGVPKLKGMSLRDALYLLENNGFKVRYKGVGKVFDYEKVDNVFTLILK